MKKVTRQKSIAASAHIELTRQQPFSLYRPGESINGTDY